MDQTPEHYDVVVVGAGFAGMYALHRFRQSGLRVRVFETGSDVGGTWYWNRYPGARCDVESHYYCYSFDDELVQDWNWSERYATQPELLAYAKHVADRFDLRSDIAFDTKVTSAEFDSAENHWVVTTHEGTRTVATFLVAAVGGLSTTQLPDIPGRDSFQGARYHTGRWPHADVDFTGQRVVVIGTGSSGVQCIPEIARQAEHLLVLQRTPNFSIPARNAPLPGAERDRVKADYPRLRAIARLSRGGVAPDGTGRKAVDVSAGDRIAEYRRRWAHGGGSILGAYEDTLVSEEANGYLAEFVRERIRDIVTDPETAELLCPTDHPFGAKRICLDSDYYATFNRDNVSLIDLRRTPIEAITATGVRIDGQVHEVDSIVFATGYDAITGPLLRLNIVGCDGLTLESAWSGGPRTYLGLACAGFPNLFMITGPGSPGALSNVLVSIEQHVEWVADHIDYLRKLGIVRSTATREAQDAWVDRVNQIASHTLFMKAASWYMGANVPGKPRVFMPYAGGVGTYREACDAVAAAGYEGFELLRDDDLTPSTTTSDTASGRETTEETAFHAP